MSAFKVSINSQIINKFEPQKVSYSGAFRVVDFTFSSLAEHIGKGHPWMPAVLDGDGRRLQVNANYAEVLGADHDGGMTIAEAMSRPFVVKHCGLGIESASSTPEKEKYRLVFRLPKPVTDWRTLRICNRYLIHLLGTADPACKDSSRFYFGALGRKPFLLNENAVLPDSFIEDAIAWNAELEAEAARKAEQDRQRWAEQRRNNPADGDDLIDIVRSALSYVDRYQPGNKTYQLLIPMIGGVLTTLGSEGERLLREWDGGIGQWGRGGFDRILSSVAKSNPSTPATLGTLFYLARSEGWTPPKTEWKDPREPDAAEYAATIAQQNEQAAIEVAQAREAISDRVLSLFGRLKRRKPKRSTKKGFALETIPVALTGDVEQVGSHTEGYMKGMERDAKLMVDVTGTGGGKSHTIVNSTPQFWGVKKLISVQPDALNPSNPKFEEWALLEGRHLGTIEKDGKLARATIDTPNSEKVSQANCSKAYGIAQATQKNPATPIYKLACFTCADAWRCPTQSGDGFGARLQAKLTWQSDTIRTSYGRMPRGEGEEATNLASSLLHLEEASSNIELSRTITLHKADVDAKYSQIARKQPELKESVEHLLLWLSAGSYRNLKAWNQKHGISFAQVRQELQQLLPSDIDWNALEALEDGAEEVEAFALSTDGKLTDKEKRRLATLKNKNEPDGKILAQMVDLEDADLTCGDALAKKQKQELKLIRKYYLTPGEKQELEELQQRHDETKWKPLTGGEMAARAKDLPLRWLKDFCEVVTGRQSGYIQFQADGTITINVRNEHHLGAIAQAQKVVITDASESRSKAELSLKYGIPEDKIFIFEVPQPDHGNLEVIQVLGLGAMGRNRGEGLEKCHQAAVTALKELDQTHQSFDWKEFGADGIHFRDTIGSNAYQTCKSISTTPIRPNMGAILAEYCVLSGNIVDLDDELFQAYYCAKYAQQMIQLKGRLRANRRPDEQLQLYIFTDDELPISCNRQIQASELTPEAARKGEKTLLQIVDAAKWVIEQGQQLTQSAVARATQLLGLKDGAGFSRQHVSRLWDAVLERIQLILDALHQKDSAPVDETSVDTYKVESAVEMIEGLAAEGHTPEALDEVWMHWFSPPEIAATWCHLSHKAQSLLLRSMFAFCPAHIFLEKMIT